MCLWLGPKKKATLLASRAIKKGYKIVVAMGGDGTVEAVMRGMVSSKVRLGIIPSGKENHIAKGLNIPQNLEDACALIGSDNTLKLDMGQAKTRKGKKICFLRECHHRTPGCHLSRCKQSCH